MNIMINGQPISYEDQGSGPAVVLMHGCVLDGSASIETLIASGYRVIVPGLPGLIGNQSESPCSLAALAETLVRLIDYLGIGRAVFCADAGGSDLLDYLHGRYPQRIAGSCQALSEEKSIKTEHRILEYLNRVRQRIPVTVPLKKVA